MRNRATLLLALLLAALPIEARAQADIVVSQGAVQLFSARSGEWRAVSKVPYRVQSGDKLKTGRDSSFTLSFADGSRVQVGPSASYTIVQAEKSAVEGLLELGRIHTWVKKQLSRRFTVRTPTAVCSVRGTEFIVDVNAGREMGIEVVEGRVAVKTMLGEEIEIGDGMPSRSLRVLPDRPLDRPAKLDSAPKKEPKAAKEEPRAAPAAVRTAEERSEEREEDLFAKDVRREVALGLSKDEVQAAAAVEARRAEYQEGKTLIDAFGKRVRLEEYIVRPAADQFKFVVLNERESRLDYFYYQAQFNQALPENLSVALRYLGGRVGSAPDYFITSFETARSNTLDSIVERATGGHLVSTPLTQDKVVYDPDRNGFTQVASGTNMWQTLFDNYTYRINGTEKYGWQPAAGANITSYDYVVGGIHTRILGGGANCAVAGCATAAPVNCTTAACETAARPATISQPDGSSKLHERVTITYAANNTREVYDFYIIDDDGRLATTADFNGVTSGRAYKEKLLQFNYEQRITASEFGGRDIDIVVEPKILIKSGVIP